MGNEKAIEEEDDYDYSTGRKIRHGSMVKSQWGNFLSTQVMPILSGLMCGASENDASILRTVYGILQGTAISDADVADTVANLWMTYNMVYRPLLQSSKIPVTTDQALYSARQYAERHR